MDRSAEYSILSRGEPMLQGRLKLRGGLFGGEDCVNGGRRLRQRVRRSEEVPKELVRMKNRGGGPGGG